MGIVWHGILEGVVERLSNGNSCRACISILSVHGDRLGIYLDMTLLNRGELFGRGNVYG